MPGRGPEPPDAACQQAMRRVWRLYDGARDELRAAFLERLATHPDFGPLVRELPDDPERRERAHALLGGALDRGDWEGYWTDVRAQAEGYANAGISLSSWMELIHIVRVELLARLLAGGNGEVTDELRALHRWLDDASGVFAQAFVDANEQVIARQQRAITQLSTPVLQLRVGLLLLPLVGGLDRERLAQLQSELLAAVRERRARVAVVDVTGVPEIDSVAANQLVAAVASARMMGAEVVVSGLSADIAKTLVTLGVDLATIDAAGDLQSGIERAEALLAR